MIRGHPPHPRLVLRRGPQPYPHRARSREHDPATPLRHRPHQGARARRRPDHASLGQESATGSRLPQDDRQRLPSRSTRLSAPCGSLPRASPPALGTRGTTAHARRPRQWTVMPKGSAIRPPKHGEIRHRAAERAAMKATRRVLDARDSTPTIRTNLPWVLLLEIFLLSVVLWSLGREARGCGQCGERRTPAAPDTPRVRYLAPHETHAPLAEPQVDAGRLSLNGIGPGDRPNA